MRWAAASAASRRLGALVVNLLLGVFAGAVSLALLLLGTVFALVSGSGRVVWAYLGALVLATAIAVFLGRRRGGGRGPSRPFPARRALVAACAVAATGLVVAFAGNALAIRLPRQAEMARWMVEHRAAFERLRDMIQSDRLEGVVSSGALFEKGSSGRVPPEEAGLTTERAGEYRRLLRLLGCEQVAGLDDGAVRFSYRSWGLANRGWRAAVVWSPREPAPLLPTIDGFPTTRVAGSEHVFARIDSSWYAYVIW